MADENDVFARIQAVIDSIKGIGPVSATGNDAIARIQAVVNDINSRTGRVSATGNDAIARIQAIVDDINSRIGPASTGNDAIARIQAVVDDIARSGQRHESDTSAGQGKIRSEAARAILAWIDSGKETSRIDRRIREAADHRAGTPYRVLRIGLERMINNGPLINPVTMDGLHSAIEDLRRNRKEEDACRFLEDLVGRVTKENLIAPRGQLRGR